MEKLLVLLVLCVCADGCGGPASQSGVWKHETLYKNVDHMRYSWGGYKDTGAEDVRRSIEEDWWGKEVPHVPGK